MDYKQIEKLKSVMINLSRYGCRLKVPFYGISGRIVGVGFKPFWTSPVDSKIEKLEINFLDDFGKLVPFIFYNIISYDVINSEEKGNIKNVSLDIHVCSLNQKRHGDPVEKVRVEMFSDKED
ncbi:MAG: hypothetical protein GX660_02180 [Clostridiaceae bacterium]|nr:hypothetical protein [Clostridiaceae bacterium]